MQRVLRMFPGLGYHRAISAPFYYAMAQSNCVMTIEKDSCFTTVVVTLCVIVAGLLVSRRC